MTGNQHSLDHARQKKAKLEGKIHQAIYDFEKEHGGALTVLDVTLTHNRDFHAGSTVSVVATVRLVERREL